MEPDYLTTEEVAQLFRTSTGTVRYWRHVGYGPTGVRVGRRVLYPRDSVTAWADRLRAASGVPAA